MGIGGKVKLTSPTIWTGWGDFKHQSLEFIMTAMNQIYHDK